MTAGLQVTSPAWAVLACQAVDPFWVQAGVVWSLGARRSQGHVGGRLATVTPSGSSVSFVHSSLLAPCDFVAMGALGEIAVSTSSVPPSRRLVAQDADSDDVSVWELVDKIIQFLPNLQFTNTKACLKRDAHFKKGTRCTHYNKN